MGWTSGWHRSGGGGERAAADVYVRQYERRINDLDVYYQWETGPNQWNQFAAVIGSYPSGPPLESLQPR